MRMFLGELTAVDRVALDAIKGSATSMSPEGQAAAFETFAATPGGGAVRTRDMHKHYAIGAACGLVVGIVGAIVLRK